MTTLAGDGHVEHCDKFTRNHPGTPQPHHCLWALGDEEMPERLERAKRYRRQAEIVRREAAGVHGDEIRQQLLNIAQQYETLAASIERQATPHSD